MQELKVIENEFIPIYETDKGIKVVNGRELHSALQSRQDFSTWVKKRLSECDAVENMDYELLHNFVEQVSGTKHRIDYIIQLDTAKEMAMLERNTKGKQVRRYFIQVENKYKAQQISKPLTLVEQIRVIAQGTDELYQRIDELDAKLEKSIADLPILGVEEYSITNAVSKKGVELLGGKQSNAYNDRSLRSKLYCDMHRELKRQFGVSTYKAIKRSQCEQAVKIITDYKPPLVMREIIKNTNAQQNLKLKGGIA